MIWAVKKIKQESKYSLMEQEWGAILVGVAKKGLSEDVTFEQKCEWGKGSSNRQ